MREVCHNIEPFPQPSPGKNPGGDCFACALTAAMRHLFPDNAPTFEQVFSWFETTYKDSDKKTLRNTWQGFEQVLWEARKQGYALECHNDFVVPDYKPKLFPHSFWFYFPTMEWGKRLEAWLNAGWIAVATIDYDGKGPVANGFWNVADHFVLIDGFRALTEPHPTMDGAGNFNEYAHVVCSAKGAGYWIKTQDLLHKHGAAALWLVREDER